MKKEDLKPGDILLCPPVPFSKSEPLTCLGHIIIAITKGKVSHSAVYCGSINGIQVVAHSDLPGIATIKLSDFLLSEHICYVFRHKALSEAQNVANIAIEYTKGANPYPKLNLGVLGILLLYNRFSVNIFNNKKFYYFTIWLSLKIMQEVQKIKNKDKTPMTCSQFAAQCYTDSGKDFDIKFNKMFIQAGFFEQNSIEGSTTLFSYISRSESKKNIFLESVSINKEEIINNEYNIINGFINLLEDQEKNKILYSQNVENKSLEIQYAGKMLLNALNEYVPDMVNITKDSNSAEIQFSTKRNYFVTPDDLYFNTNNLEEVGSLSLCDI